MPITSRSADLAFALKDAGVPVISAASSTYGVLRNMDTVESNDGMPFQKRSTVLTVLTGSIADLAVDLALTVNGEPYVVRIPELEKDGALTRILIAEVTP